MWKYVVLFWVAATVSGEDAREARIVNIEQGPVRGYKMPKEKVFSFYGIPYATAPTGVHKFKAPLAPPQWKLPFEAINKNIVCPQNDYGILSVKNQQEDCLIANIYVPDTNKKNLPVVVHVHGGAYLLGSGDLITMKQWVAEKNMIVVNFNYRLGVHGFLCLGTEDVPGNAGMKDQVALLRWVKKNIASFGGNPDDITLMGYSAGGSSVDLLLLSPMTKGLFNKVIPESGANLCAFSVQADPIEIAWKYAKMLNFTNPEQDFYSLEDFYKSVPYETLNSINIYFGTDSTFMFSPCIERDIGEERFLDDSPLNILKKGQNQKLPMLYGFAEMEGLFRIPVFDIWKTEMNKKFSDFLPGDLTFSSDEEKEQVAERVKRFYFGEKPVGKETIFRYIDYFSDVLFSYGILKSVQLQVESGNKDVYLYQISFVDDNTAFVPYTEVRGSDHCALTYIISDGNLMNATLTPTKELLNMQQQLRQLWINFITTGKPVPEGSSFPKWPATDKNGAPYMSLDNTLKLQGPLLQQRILFWDDIYEKYYRMPVPPPSPPPRK